MGLLFRLFADRKFIKQMQKELHKKSRIETMEEGLARARAAIRKATRMRNYTSYKKESFVPRGSIYINPYAFHQLSSSIAMIYNLDSFFVWKLKLYILASNAKSFKLRISTCNFG